MATRQVTLVAVAAAVVVAAGVGVYLAGRQFVVYRRQPDLIMGTTVSLQAVARRHEANLAERALRAAESALRDVEVRMSPRLELSELSLLNRGKVGEEVKLSPETLAVLRAAERLAKDTNGAFDVTCGPVLALWRAAARTNRLPRQAQIDSARAKCGWDKIELLEAGARRLSDSVTVDVGGIAKGYGIDKAVDAMKAEGIIGGLVNAGGDIRCFGRGPAEQPWPVPVQSPFDSSAFLCIVVAVDVSVCTSGNYERFSEIQGKRHSHIVDPGTGRPAELAPSVTVVAPTATTADAWATALSVLGRGGLKLVDALDGIEAMLVVGEPEDWRWYASNGFEKLLLEPLPASRRGRKTR